MTQTTLTEAGRTATYDSGTFVQWTDNNDAIKLAFTTAWNMELNMDGFDIDKIDTAKPIYTEISDVRGTFSFNLKNLVTLWDTALPSADDLLLSTMAQNIASGDPSVLIFAPVMKAAKSISNPYLNIVFTGRVTTLPLSQILDQGVQDVEITGEIIGLIQMRREASANNEG